MIGKTLAHYEITSQIGKGGMGEVYQATDTKLGRAVAIKVLRKDYSNDPELRGIISFSHPGIIFQCKNEIAIHLIARPDVESCMR